MKRSTYSVLSLVLAGLGFLMAGVFAVAGQARGLSGEIRLLPDTGEHVAACTLDTPDSEHTPFDNPAAWEGFDEAAFPNTFALPFSLRLVSATALEGPRARNIVTVVGPESETNHVVEPGTEIALADASLHVAEIRKWAGLVRIPNGRTMAILAFRFKDEPWMENVVISGETWAKVGEDIGAYLTWHESEAEARATLDAGLGLASVARWGVVEGDNVHWFDSFVPGTGIELKDGTEVVLMARKDDQDFNGELSPAIRVHVAEKDRARTNWIRANDQDPDGLVRFDCYSTLKAVFFVAAWRDGAALIYPHYNEFPCGDRVLSEGEVWKPGGMPYAVRLDQVMESAAAVSADESPVREAVLQTSDDVVRVREGQAVQWNDVRLTFTHEAPPPPVRYELGITWSGEPEELFTLAPGDTAQRRGWHISQGIFSDPEKMAVLCVERPDRRPALALGLAFGLAGLCGFGLSRIGGRRAAAVILVAAFVAVPASAAPRYRSRVERAAPTEETPASAEPEAADNEDALDTGSPAEPFELEDQFKNTHKLAVPPEKVTVLMFADRRSALQARPWVEALYNRYKERVALEGVGVGRGVPRWERGLICFLVRQATPSPVMFDWKGDIGRRYGYVRKSVNVLIIDSNGIIVSKTVGEKTPERFEEVCAALDELVVQNSKEGPSP